MKLLADQINNTGSIGIVLKFFIALVFGLSYLIICGSRFPDLEQTNANYNWVCLVVSEWCVVVRMLVLNNEINE